LLFRYTQVFIVEMEQTGNKGGTSFHKKEFMGDQLREVGSSTQHTMMMNVHRQAFHLFGLPVDRQGLFGYIKSYFAKLGFTSYSQPIDYTRLDLAIQAENRELLGHEYVQRFLDKVWTSPSEARGLFSLQPRHKFYLHFSAFAIFLLL
jgi:hypothetical protein